MPGSRKPRWRHPWVPGRGGEPQLRTACEQPLSTSAETGGTTTLLLWKGWAGPAQPHHGSPRPAEGRGGPLTPGSTAAVSTGGGSGMFLRPAAGAEAQGPREEEGGTHLTPSFSASCPVGLTTISKSEGIFLYRSCCCCSCCGERGSWGGGGICGGPGGGRGGGGGGPPGIGRPLGEVGAGGPGGRGGVGSSPTPGGGFGRGLMPCFLSSSTSFSSSAPASASSANI